MAVIENRFPDKVIINNLYLTQEEIAKNKNVEFLLDKKPEINNLIQECNSIIQGILFNTIKAYNKNGDKNISIVSHSEEIQQLWIKMINRSIWVIEWADWIRNELEGIIIVEDFFILQLVEKSLQSYRIEILNLLNKIS